MELPMTVHVRARTTIGLAALVCLVAAGCSSSKAAAPGVTAAPSAPGAATTVAAIPTTAGQAAGATTASPNQGPVADVAIVDLAFQPATLTIKPGTTVRFTNNDGFGHTVTATDNSYTSGTIAAGANYTHWYDTPGSYTYHCTIHSRMTATIVVAP
jgi:plastocyanin